MNRNSFTVAVPAGFAAMAGRCKIALRFCRTPRAFSPLTRPANKKPGNSRVHLFGGEGGIRTLGRLAPTPDFESGTFNRSATSPETASSVHAAGRNSKEAAPYKQGRSASFCPAGHRQALK